MSHKTFRGSRSIEGNNAALIIVDGVPVDQTYLANINPNDIEDATATIPARRGPCLTIHNTAGGAGYTLLPSNLYSIKDTVITIPAGYRVGAISVHLNLPLFPASHPYAFPLAIVNGGGLVISGNSGTFMWLFKR